MNRTALAGWVNRTAFAGWVIAAATIGGPAARAVEPGASVDFSQRGQVHLPPAELSEVQWMLGRWNLSCITYETPTRPAATQTGEAVTETALNRSWLQTRLMFPTKAEEDLYLSFDHLHRSWVLIDLDLPADVQAMRNQGARWENDTLTLFDREDQMGDNFMIRAVLTRSGDDGYSFSTDQQLPDESWLPLDKCTFQRQTAKP